MLVFYRSIPWLVGLLTFGAFALVSTRSNWFLAIVVLLALLTALLYARLIDLPKHDVGFWNFLLTPVALTLSGAFFFVFLESPLSLYLLGIALAVLHLVYAEHLFYYFHQPSLYRVYTLERVSLIFSLATIFLLSSSLFGLLILLQVPLWAVVPVFFLAVTGSVYGTLWVSKVDSKRGSPYALALGLLLTQVFLALSFLPIGHVTNAAVLTAFLYLFLGMSRADFMDRLTRSVFLRYLFFTMLVIAMVLTTTKWV